LCMCVRVRVRACSGSNQDRGVVLKISMPVLTWRA